MITADKAGGVTSPVPSFFPTTTAVFGLVVLAILGPPARAGDAALGQLLIHLDIKKFGRFDRPGHHATGTRTGCRTRDAGWDFVHVAVDDAARLACVAVRPDERKVSTTAVLLRALRWFRSHGIEVERVMTDNAGACRSRRFRKALRSGQWRLRLTLGQELLASRHLLLHRTAQAGKGGLFRHRKGLSETLPKSTRSGRKRQVFRTFLNQS